MVVQVRGVVVRCTRLLHSLYPSLSFLSPSLPPIPPRLSLSLSPSSSLSPQHRTCKTSRGTSLRSWSLSLIIRCTRLRCTRLQHRTCKTSRSTSLRSWFQKKCLLPIRILIFFFQKNHRFWKIKVGFFSNWKSFWNFFLKYSELSFYKLIMTEVSRHLRNIFFRKIHQILKLEVVFFPDIKCCSQIFQNTEDKIHGTVRTVPSVFSKKAIN